MSVNKIILLGHVGKDAEIKETSAGKMGRFGLAITEYGKDSQGNRTKNTDWYNVECWKYLAEFAEKYVKQGMVLYVEGRLRFKEYTGKDGVTRKDMVVLAEKMDFAMAPNRESAPAPVAQPAAAPSYSAPSYGGGNNSFDGGDLPF